MKRTGIILLVVCAAALSLFLTSCPAKSPTTTPEPSANLTTPTTTPSNEPLGTPKLTGAVDTAELASQIAGFKVVEPSYIPDGYSGGLFMITNLGAGLPEELKPKFNSMEVQRVYRFQNDRNTMILLTQSNHKTDIAGGEPTTLCGFTAQRAFSKTDPRYTPHDELTFSWEINGNYFILTGWLGTTLDEATLIKMACSIKND
jgi:Domain of unknown function (DUF4367)